MQTGKATTCSDGAKATAMTKELMTIIGTNPQSKQDPSTVLLYQCLSTV